MRKMNYGKIAGGWVLGLILSQLAYGQATAQLGQISGTVVGDDGKPLSGIFVTYVRTPFDVKDTVPGSGGVTTDASGSYSFTSLIPATYTICTYAPPSTALVQACEWGPQQPQITLTAGQNVTGNTITMHTGVRLHIQVADPLGLAKASDWTVGPTTLNPGVWGPDGLFHHAHIRSGGNGQMEYILVVPVQLSLTPYIDGTNLLFSTGAKTGIGILGSITSTATSILATLTGGDQIVNFQITGTAPTSVVTATPTPTITRN